jgi:ferredoxin
MIEESQTYGMDDLLRWHANSLETACGTCRVFVENEEVEVKKGWLPKK